MDVEVSPDLLVRYSGESGDSTVGRLNRAEVDPQYREEVEDAAWYLTKQFPGVLDSTTAYSVLCRLLGA